MKLYDYYRSSSSYRVRIALNLKNTTYETISVHLLNQGGEQHLPPYLQKNPQGLVPTLDVDGKTITQSLAIIEYLDEQYPHPPLLPKSSFEKAQVRSLALMIACDIHPLNNLRVLQQLKTSFKATEEQVKAWYQHWIKTGFEAIESTLERLPRTHSVCSGSNVSLADVCLIPQVYNAQRYEVSLEPYPLIRNINDYCLTLPAFQKAAP